jgi:phytoene dehydrogenase-like protein
MSNSYDIVAIGSGHNGLVAAAYMAAAGKKVLVLERNKWFGGGVASGQFVAPGYTHDYHSMAHIFIQGNPLLRNDELGLKARFGLEYRFPEVPFMSVFDDGSTLGFTTDPARNYDEIAKFSTKDADAYVAMAATADKYLPMLMASFYTPPVPVGASMAMLDQSREGRELFQIMQKSAYDVVADLFEHEKVRLHFMRLVCENLEGPEERGTGLGLYVFAGFVGKFGMGVPVGGSGALSAALIRCIEAHGGSVIAETPVARVEISNGRATGVTTESGEHFQAKDAVIGSIHPHLLGKFVASVDPAVLRAAERTKLSAVACFVVHAALREALQFRAGEHVRKAYMIELLPTRLDLLRQFFDQLRYGRIPDYSMLGLGSPTNFDPSRAPAGGATMQMWDYVPYAHPDGGPKHWDEAKQAFARTMVERAQPFISNLTEANIVAIHADSPVDMERTSPSFQGGDIHGVAPLSYQQGAHRPTPDLGRNKVPGIERLYLVGPFQHPGGGVFGAGRATAMIMCEDLKINFDRLTRH